MPLALYIICALSCIQTILPGWDENGNHDPHPTGTSLYASYRDTQTQTPKLDLHEEITDDKAHALFQFYSEELDGKSQNQLNLKLQYLLRISNHVSNARNKLIALMHVCAQPRLNIDDINRFIQLSIEKDDISLVQYALKRKLIDSNQNYTGLFGSYPILWKCQSTSMADLLISHGADITKKDWQNNNIIHYFCGPYAKSENTLGLIQLYSSKCPLLIDEQNNFGETPLVTSIRLLTDPYPLQRRYTFSCIYTLLDLDASINIWATLGDHAGKTPYKMVISKAAQVSDEEFKNELLRLAQKMGSLFELLYDELDDDKSMVTPLE